MTLLPAPEKSIPGGGRNISNRPPKEQSLSAAVPCGLRTVEFSCPPAATGRTPLGRCPGETGRGNQRRYTQAHTATECIFPAALGTWLAQQSLRRDGSGVDELFSPSLDYPGLAQALTIGVLTRERQQCWIKASSWGYVLTTNEMPFLPPGHSNGPAALPQC